MIDGVLRRRCSLALIALLAAFAAAIVAQAWSPALLPPRLLLNIEAFFALTALALGALSASLLKKGTDYSVPRRELCKPPGAVGVDRAVCPLFQQARDASLFQQAGARFSQTRGDIFAAALISLGAIAAFASTRNFYFVSDDFLILGHAQAHWSLAWLRTLMTTPGGDGHFGPLVYIFNTLNWRAAGSDASAWHWTGYAIHAINCALVYALAAALGYALGARIFASALFAIHASRPEAVVWITARFDLLSTVFVLAALLCLLRGMRAARIARLAYFAATLLFMTAGMLSKEAAFAFPLLALLLIATQSKQPLRQWPAAISICAVAAVIFAYRWTLFGGIGGYLDASGRPQFLSLTPIVIAKSLGLRLWASLFFPVNWTLPIPKILAVSTALYALALAILFHSGASKRRMFEAATFTFLSALPVVSRLLISTDLEGSRILYLPSIGFCLLIAALIESVDWKITSAAAAAILIFEAAALRHNLTAWENASNIVRQSCQAVAECALRANGAASVIALPRKVDGVYTFANGFPECVAMQPGASQVQVKMSDHETDRAQCAFTWDAANRRLRQISAVP